MKDDNKKKRQNSDSKDVMAAGAAALAATTAAVVVSLSDEKAEERQQATPPADDYTPQPPAEAAQPTPAPQPTAQAGHVEQPQHPEQDEPVIDPELETETFRQNIYIEGVAIEDNDPEAGQLEDLVEVIEQEPTADENDDVAINEAISDTFIIEPEVPTIDPTDVDEPEDEPEPTDELVIVECEPVEATVETIEDTPAEEPVFTEGDVVFHMPLEPEKQDEEEIADNDMVAIANDIEEPEDTAEEEGEEEAEEGAEGESEQDDTHTDMVAQPEQVEEAIQDIIHDLIQEVEQELAQDTPQQVAQQMPFGLGGDHIDMNDTDDYTVNQQFEGVRGDNERSYYSGGKGIGYHAPDRGDFAPGDADENPDNEFTDLQ